MAIIYTYCEIANNTNIMEEKKLYFRDKTAHATEHDAIQALLGHFETKYGQGKKTKHEIYRSSEGAGTIIEIQGETSGVFSFLAIYEVLKQEISAPKQ